jgi:hypothetical protein
LTQSRHFGLTPASVPPPSLKEYNYADWRRWAPAYRYYPLPFIAGGTLRGRGNV